jgi:hypothetical protein
MQQMRRSQVSRAADAAAVASWRPEQRGGHFNISRKSVETRESRLRVSVERAVLNSSPGSVTLYQLFYMCLHIYIYSFLKQLVKKISSGT